MLVGFREGVERIRNFGSRGGRYREEGRISFLGVFVEFFCAIRRRLMGMGWLLEIKFVRVWFGVWFCIWL